MKPYFKVGTIFIGILILLVMYTGSSNTEEVYRELKANHSTLGVIFILTIVLAMFIAVWPIIWLEILKEISDNL